MILYRTPPRRQIHCFINSSAGHHSSARNPRISTPISRDVSAIAGNDRESRRATTKRMRVTRFSDLNKGTRIAHPVLPVRSLSAGAPVGSPREARLQRENSDTNGGEENTCALDKQRWMLSTLDFGRFRGGDSEIPSRFDPLLFRLRW